MKNIVFVFVLFLFLAACNNIDSSDLALNEKDDLLKKEQFDTSLKWGNMKYSIQIIKPDSTIEYQMKYIKPDPNLDFKILRIPPRPSINSIGKF